MNRTYYIHWKTLAYLGLGVLALCGAFVARHAVSQESYRQTNGMPSAQFPPVPTSGQSVPNWPGAAGNWENFERPATEAPQDWPYRNSGGGTGGGTAAAPVNSYRNNDPQAPVYAGNRAANQTQQLAPNQLPEPGFAQRAATGFTPAPVSVPGRRAAPNSPPGDSSFRPEAWQPSSNVPPDLSRVPAPAPAPGPAAPALNAAITPKGRVTANEWRGPASAKPVKQIRQVNYDTYADDPNNENAIPAESFLTPYSERAEQYPERVELPVINGQLKELPRDYAPWWNAVVNRAMRTSPDSLSVNVEALVLQAIEHSPQITAMRIDPRIRETVIVEEDAAFDWATFAETKYNRSNDPVGNRLTVGGTGTRYVDDTVYAKGGVKKRFNQGAQFDVSQRVGYQDNNSTFFSPKPQGTARLELNLTQPLMRGAGSMVNESRTVLAFLDRDISEEELSEGLQTHLLAVYQAYWSLYRSRSVKLQKQRLLDRAEHILQWLVGRQGLDTKKSQVLRAQAAVASRRSEIVRAEMAIRNAESQLRLLVNSPNLKEKNQLELLPAELPLSVYVDVSLRGSLETALKHRPDISEAIQRMKATSLRLGVAKNDLLPKLDVVLGTYVAGLQKSDIGEAYGHQYNTGGPGYTIGLTFEYPLGNRAAKARHERREWEMAKALKEFEAAVETGMTEVELAAREHETSYQEMLARFQSMLAAEADASNLEQRFTDASGNPDVVVGILLEDMLEAQARVAAEEAEFVESQVNYVLAIVKLKKATGVLLNCECGPVGTMPASAKESSDADAIQIPELPVPEPVRGK